MVSNVRDFRKEISIPGTNSLYTQNFKITYVLNNVLKMYFNVLILLLEQESKEYPEAENRKRRHLGNLKRPEASFFQETSASP